jgi:hypothetical protein
MSAREHLQRAVQLAADAKQQYDQSVDLKDDALTYRFLHRAEVLAQMAAANAEIAKAYALGADADPAAQIADLARPWPPMHPEERR